MAIKPNAEISFCTGLRKALREPDNLFTRSDRMRTVLAVAAAILLNMSVALAHSFNVALLVGPSDSAENDAGQIRDGFLLATRERDSHPDEESDGHLGGLDVYLFPVDERGDLLAGVRALLGQEAIDILAVVGPDALTDKIRPLTAGMQTVLLAPGRMTFPGAATPAEQVFVETFTAAFGYPPSQSAARGYNAARRIDAAVRAQGGVSDKAALDQALRASESGFDW
jgi:hypothetical protein